MTSANTQLGYYDPKTDRYEKLPLPSTSYDPESEAKKRYERGEKVVYWSYNSEKATWGQPFPWTPPVKKAAKPQTPKPSQKRRSSKNTNNRTLKDLNPSEREILQSLLSKDNTPKEISDILGLNLSSIYNARHNYKKTSSKPATQTTAPAKSTPSTPSTPSAKSQDPWQKADSIMNQIKLINEQIAHLEAERLIVAEELQTILAEINRRQYVPLFN